MSGGWVGSSAIYKKNQYFSMISINLGCPVGGWEVANILEKSMLFDDFHQLGMSSVWVESSNIHEKYILFDAFHQLWMSGGWVGSSKYTGKITTFR